MRTNFVRTSLRTLPGWFALYCEPEAANLIANLARCTGRYELQFVPNLFEPLFVLSPLIVFAGAGGATAIRSLVLACCWKRTRAGFALVSLRSTVQICIVSRVRCQQGARFVHPSIMVGAGQAAGGV